jgi:hypothetical protein
LTVGFKTPLSNLTNYQRDEEEQHFFEKPSCRRIDVINKKARYYTIAG